MTIKRRRRRKVVPMRRPVSRAERRRWNAAADKLLERTEEMFELSGDFDTAVRDSVSTGLAYIVNAAYDCRACGMDFSNTEKWLTFIESATGEWFRKHGFVECLRQLKQRIEVRMALIRLSGELTKAKRS